MSDNIVKQLRENQPMTQDMVSSAQCALQDEAADLIEQLQAQVAALKKTKNDIAGDKINLRGENEFLKDKLVKTLAVLNVTAENLHLVMTATGCQEETQVAALRSYRAILKELKDVNL